MHKSALVIGTGPAGLMAAEALARNGHSVTIAEAKPSPGRKFLMAGKSGLNITKDEPQDSFARSLSPAGPLAPMLTRFGPVQATDFAEALGQSVFTGSSGRVFPKSMKASPLLRAWMARLDGMGVTLKTRWRWVGWDKGETLFDTPQGRVTLEPDVTILALGGASWARLGSDGLWTGALQEAGATVTPFQGTNVGFNVAWSAHMTTHFGTPVKSVRLTAGGPTTLGEFIVSRSGIEGSGIYALSSALRTGAPLKIDLMPDWSTDKITQSIARPRGKTNLTNHLRKVLKLPPVKLALLRECAHPLPENPRTLANIIKSLPLPIAGPRPMDEAISTAGGLSWDSLTPELMLKARPGVFCAGEMLDWEAPTGGYLITACLATGLWAGEHAAVWHE
ncbi:MAG: putative flavoprotein (TIGR03862 family) [Paracoccaceae bacterium]|jgi:uncharacterized flavoprotein (TIGR03862 family)